MIFGIGMVEDDKAEASAIMLSLNVNSDQLNEESFKLYGLQKTAELRDQLFQEIRQDIVDNKVQCILVDYKLDTLKEVLEGIEIVEYLHEEVPEFPVVILTNVPDRGKENDGADPDKVYPKQTFMIPDNQNTKDMVYHIVRNMERYSKRRSELELRQRQLLDQVAEDADVEDEVYGELLDVERELSKYVPMEMNVLDETYDVEDMNKALAALREYRELLE